MPDEASTRGSGAIEIMMPIVSFVVNQNRLAKMHVEIDVETLNETALAFVDAFFNGSKSHPIPT